MNALEQHLIRHIQLHACICSSTGVGIAMFLASVAVALYYNMIIAWTVYYTYSSMTSDLPWQYCNHDYNTPSESPMLADSYAFT